MHGSPIASDVISLSSTSAIKEIPKVITPIPDYFLIFIDHLPFQFSEYESLSPTISLFTPTYYDLLRSKMSVIHLYVPL